MKNTFDASRPTPIARKGFPCAVLQIRLLNQVYVLRKLYQGLLLSVEYHEINKV